MSERSAKFHWVSAHGEPFEPAEVQYWRGKAEEVYFIGMEDPMDAFQCEIAEEIVRIQKSA